MSRMQSLDGLSDSPSQFSGKRSRSSILEIDSWMPSKIQATPLVDVYDAATTFGGSGAPFNRSGKVIGVTFAVLHDFGGSNLAMPARYADELKRRFYSPTQGNAASASGPSTSGITGGIKR